MLKMTRKYGLGVLLIFVTIASAIGIIKGELFFHDQGRGVALLIVFGLGIYSAMIWNMAAKINVSNNAQGAEKETKVKARQNVNVAQHS